MYAKFLKEFLSPKKKIDEHETFAIGEEECSVAVLTKLKVPCSFSYLT